MVCRYACDFEIIVNLLFVLFLSFELKGLNTIKVHYVPTTVFIEEYETHHLFYYFFFYKKICLFNAI